MLIRLKDLIKKAASSVLELSADPDENAAVDRGDPENPADEKEAEEEKKERAAKSRGQAVGTAGLKPRDAFSAAVAINREDEIGALENGEMVDR